MMILRSPEAAHLESDYLARVRRSLDEHSAPEAEEIIESLQEHIEAELTETAESPVGLVDMASVLEKLGPPEVFSQDTDEIISSSSENHPSSSTTPVFSPSPAASTSHGSKASSLPTPPPLALRDPHEFAELLDKIWIGYFIYVIGLYIPVIEFQICSVIAFGIFSYLLWRRSSGEELKVAGRASAVNVGILFVSSILCSIALAVPGIMVLAIPFLVGQIICELLVYWRIVGRTATILAEQGKTGDVEKLCSARIGYTIYYFLVIIVAAIAGGIIGLNGGKTSETWIVGLVLLPFHWFFGYLLILRPLALARQKLRESVQTR